MSAKIGFKDCATPCLSTAFAIKPIANNNSTATGRANTAPLDDAGQAHVAHQSDHRTTRYNDPLTGELPADLAYAVDTEVRLIHAPDRRRRLS